MNYYKGIKRYIPMFVALILIAIIAIVGSFAGWFDGGEGSSKPADIYDVYNMRNSKGVKLGSDTAAIVLQAELTKERATVVDGEYYVTYDFITELNSRFYWDVKEKTLVYTTATDKIKVKLDQKTYSLSGKKKKVDYTIAWKEDDSDDVYINLKFVKLFTDITYETYQDPGRVVIYNDFSEEYTYATVEEEVNMRAEGDKESGIMRTIAPGEEFTVFEQGVKWTKIATEDGLLGYVPTQKLNIERTELVDTGFEAPEYTSIQYEDKISLAWHQVNGAAGNTTLSEYMANVKGVNVISPTWFTLTDTQGNIECYATQDYVDQAHAMGLKVWALIDDFSIDDTGTRCIRSVIPRTSRRERLIKQLMAYVKEYDIDGINVDFEYINSDNGENYIQFLRELSVECRKAGVVLSVDNYVASAWTIHYDRKEQSILCDYLIIMGYDEHTSGSEEAGSVASLSFVRNGIESTIEEVGSSDKIINAVPFYTRAWYENANGGLSSEAIGMQTAEDAIAAAGAAKNWSEEDGQYYCEFQSGTSTCKIWLEDAKSIGVKLDLMKEYNLAGAAYWKLSFETADIWDVVESYFK
jgi:spore germination protein YaaH